MNRLRRIRLTVAAIAAIGLLVGVAWYFIPRAADPAASLRGRLVGDNARAVVLLLGEPDYKENDDRKWHYMNDAALRRYVNRSQDVNDLVIEFDDEQVVTKVYLED
jgi:hypothetical protein